MIDGTEAELDGALCVPVTASRTRGTWLARAFRRWGTALGVMVPVALVTALALLFPAGHGPPPEPLIVALVATTWIGPAARLLARLLDRSPGIRELVVHPDRVVLERVDGSERTVPRAQVIQAFEAYDPAPASSVTANEVQALLDDPNATATQRIAAAIALANAPGENVPHRERIRVAASAAARHSMRPPKEP